MNTINCLIYLGGNAFSETNHNRIASYQVMDAINASNSHKGLCIAIDGPAGAGKSTVAQKVADTLGYLYIDTGAMYRAATWITLEQKIDIADSNKIISLVAAADIELKPPDQSSRGRVRVFVNNDDVTMIVRSRIISRFVSPVSAIAGVRKILVAKQQTMAAKGGVVMDGRDIGTVVLPKAEIKIFLTASAEIRAQRRLQDLKELGQVCDYQTVLTDIQARDLFDSTREESPLRKADDALELNTDNISADEVVQKILQLCKETVR